jgi:hypothetical protein
VPFLSPISILILSGKIFYNVKLNEILARIKWKPVAVLVIVLAVLFVVLFGSLGNMSFNLFSPTYKEGGDIRERSWADPGRVDLKGTSFARVDVKNVGTEASNIRVRLETYNPSLFFIDTESQKANETVSLGPGESRQLGFKLKFNATYGGRYGVKVTVSPGGENIEDEIFFDVVEK